jgi:hypothetical protein
MGVPLLGYALLRKSDELNRLALAILVFTALVAIPVYLTGEPSEEAVEKLPGVSEALIEQHEEGAKVSLILAIISGAIALVSIFAMRLKKEIAGWFVLLPLVFSIATAVSMARTANLGGQIRHTEIRGVTANSGQAVKPETEKEDDED